MRAFANIWTNVQASLDQQPSTTSPKTTKRGSCTDELRARFFASAGSPQSHTILVQQHLAPSSHEGCVAAGVSQDSPESPTCTFERPGASNTTKIPRKRPKERRKE